MSDAQKDRIIALLDDLKKGQAEQIRIQAEGLEIQKKQFEIVSSQFEKTKALQDRAELIQQKSERLMDTARRMQKFFLPIIIALILLIVYLVWEWM